MKIGEECLEKGHKKGMTFMEFYVGYAWFVKIHSSFLMIRSVFTQFGIREEAFRETSGKKSW